MCTLEAARFEYFGLCHHRSVSVDLGSIAFVCYLDYRLSLITFDSCAQNNVEASGAVEDEGLAPGGAGAGAGSTEPPRAAGWITPRQHGLCFFLFCFGFCPDLLQDSTSQPVDSSQGSGLAGFFFSISFP